MSLKKAKLQAGNRAIIVEAYAADSLQASKTVLISVLDKVSVKLDTDQPQLIIQRGADVTLVATARDRDGSALPGSAITWSSHLDGQLSTGEKLSFANLSSLSLGEHIITVMAAGKDGSVGSLLQAVRINGVDEQQSPKPSVLDLARELDNLGQRSPDDSGVYPPNQFGYNNGQQIDSDMPSHFLDPFGPGMGGAPPDPGLGTQMNDFFSSYGGGFGGGGFGGAPGGFGGAPGGFGGAPGGFGGGFGW
ncbi:MAG: hypothetical protein EOM15_14465 [Spirochaetia bacterium]|nr:hypothetical protein [Spirochaetia bacterium]